MIAIPAVNECLALMDQYGMLNNIRQHSFIVARVAETLVREIAHHSETAPPPPDLDLVLAGALLHDIAKTTCLDGSCQHDEEGMRICCRHGYPEVGQIVREHVLLKSFTPDEYERGHFPAREIIYYADKRVRHTEIVSLEERYDYIIDIYSRKNEVIKKRIRQNFDRCSELEQYLFKFLPFYPAELSDWVTPEPF
jgi:uncharacterized protein